jgi:hypothetical protein
MAEPGIEPRTSWLVVRSSDHQATGLVEATVIKLLNALTVALSLLCSVYSGNVE